MPFQIISKLSELSRDLSLTPLRVPIGKDQLQPNLKCETRVIEAALRAFAFSMQFKIKRLPLSRYISLRCSPDTVRLSTHRQDLDLFIKASIAQDFCKRSFFQKMFGLIRATGPNLWVH